MCQALLGHTYMSHDKKKITTTTSHHTTPHPFASNQQSSVAGDIKSSGLIQGYIVSIRKFSNHITTTRHCTHWPPNNTIHPRSTYEWLRQMQTRTPKQNKLLVAWWLCMVKPKWILPLCGKWVGLHMTLECRDIKLWPISKCVTLSGASQCVCLCSDSGQSE
jgi:hypothetical protein